jgi:hypothetical protein
MLLTSEQEQRRVNKDVNIIATCPETFGSEPVATFVLTLSIKVVA